MGWCQARPNVTNAITTLDGEKTKPKDEPRKYPPFWLFPMPPSLLNKGDKESAFNFTMSIPKLVKIVSKSILLDALT